MGPNVEEVWWALIRVYQLVCVCMVCACTTCVVIHVCVYAAAMMFLCSSPHSSATSTIVILQSGAHRCVICHICVICHSCAVCGTRIELIWHC